MTETHTKWSERVTEWRASGQSAPDFAAGRDFKASTLVYWASHLRHAIANASAPGQPERGVRMVRVVARPSDSGEMLVQVGSVRVVVRPGFDAALLRQVIQALGGGA